MCTAIRSKSGKKRAAPSASVWLQVKHLVSNVHFGQFSDALNSPDGATISFDLVFFFFSLPSSLEAPDTRVT